MEPRNKRRHWLINLSESCHRIVGFVFPAMLVASLTNHAKSDQRSTSFRRPELVAIAWHNDFTSRKLQAWRADGDLLDEEETSWIANDVHRIQRRQASNFGRDLHQLVLVFRIDESAVSSQVIRCRVRQEGRPHAFGSGSPSTRNHLAKSSLTTAKNRLPKWPPHLDIEALVPDGEPEVIHKLDGPPDRPIKLASGIEWSVGLRRRAFLGLKGDPEEDVPCCLLRTDSTLSPPLDEFQFEIKLRDGTWVPWRSARTINESPDVQWTVSDPLDEANPITSITITRLRRRLEIYEMRERNGKRRQHPRPARGTRHRRERPDEPAVRVCQLLCRPASDLTAPRLACLKARTTTHSRPRRAVRRMNQAEELSG